MASEPRDPTSSRWTGKPDTAAAVILFVVLAAGALGFLVVATWG